MSTVVEVLRLPDYRRFIAAAICAGVGLWIFQTALYWAALQSGTTGTVGALVAVLSVPSLVLTIPAGYLTDRLGPFWLLFLGQAAPAAACALGVAMVGADGTIAFGPAAGVTLVVGIAYALWNVPAIVYVTRIVKPGLLGSAIALMALQFAVGRIVGGALGGALVEVGGAGLAFASSSLVFVLGLAIVLTLPRMPGLEYRTGSTLQGMVEAVRWLRSAPATLVLVVLAGTASLLAYAYIPLLGALSRDVIGAGPGGLGVLTAASGVGMFIAALGAHAVGIRVGRGRGVVVSMALGACAMAVLGASTVLVASVVLVAVVAFLGSTRSALAQLLIQTLAPPRMRGRVASLADFVAQVMAIIGSITVGELAAAWGPTAVLVACGIGIVSIVALITFAWPRFLSLDVDEASQPMVAGRPYAEGGRPGAFPEHS